MKVLKWHSENEPKIPISIEYEYQERKAAIATYDEKFCWIAFILTFRIKGTRFIGYRMSKFGAKERTAQKASFQLNARLYPRKQKLLRQQQSKVLLNSFQ